MTHTQATTRQAVVAFVCMINSDDQTFSDSDALVAALRTWVADSIGAIARPRDIHAVNELPKTRSGKIMRRLLRDITEGREVGDVTTLADTAVIATIQVDVARETLGVTHEVNETQ